MHQGLNRSPFTCFVAPVEQTVASSNFLGVGLMTDQDEAAQAK